MNKTILFFLIFLLHTIIGEAQTLRVYNLDISNFPIIKSNFLVLDNNLKQITGFSTSDFEVIEQGMKRNVLSISCPQSSNEVPISSLLMLDISGSMSGVPIDIVKEAASVWTDQLQGKSECAVGSFSDNAYINQDFTKNKNKLLNAITSLHSMSGTNFDNAFLASPYGAIPIVKGGKYKKIIIHISDGGANFPPNEDEIIRKAQADSITIFALTINNLTPDHTKHFTEKTGGLWFQNIRTKEDAENVFRFIYAYIQFEPCTIEWQSGISCVTGETLSKIIIPSQNLSTYANYLPPANSYARLDMNPKSVKMKNIPPGTKKDTVIKITALNADFNVTEIKSSNPAFFVTPNSFFIKNGETKDITLSFVPVDSGYIYTKISLENDLCYQTIFASGGFPGKKPTIKTIKLIKPNGGEVWIAGTDTLITWDGILPEEKVTLEYSTNKGLNWQLITDNATGLQYKWHIPRTPSNECIARVTAKSSYLDDIDAVEICNQIWMRKNLDVVTYLNGDTIPEVQDPTIWNRLTSGAWCYFNNDSANGAIYGKLYNWYAINDIRGLAPIGWQIPDTTDLNELFICVGGQSVGGSKLKSTGSLGKGDGLWLDQTNEGTDEYQFTALPAGLRNSFGTFSEINRRCCFWTSTKGIYYTLSYTNTAINLNYWDCRAGFSVRCIKK